MTEITSVSSDKTTPAGGVLPKLWVTQIDDVVDDKTAQQFLQFKLKKLQDRGCVSKEEEIDVFLAESRRAGIQCAGGLFLLAGVLAECVMEAIRAINECPYPCVQAEEDASCGLADNILDLMATGKYATPFYDEMDEFMVQFWAKQIIALRSLYAIVSDKLFGRAAASLPVSSSKMVP